MEIQQERIQAVVLRKYCVTSDVMCLALGAGKGGSLAPFTAGAHVEVTTPAGCVRQYSLCNDPADASHYLLAVLREPASRGGSASLHTQVAEGDTLEISQPRNLFPLVEDARHSVLMAGGIGITPLLAMAHVLHRAGASFELHYCGRSPETMAFAGDLRACEFADRVRLHTAGRASFDVETLLKVPGAATHLYTCGPQGFIDRVLAAATDAGWPREHLHREYFGIEADPEASNSFEIEISSTGEVIHIPAHRSVADVLSDHGICIPISCEQGVCGSCVTQVLAGEPDHRDFILDDAQKAVNDCFTPCCSRALSPRLVLGL